LITSTTYIGVPGANVIIAPELAFTIIYGVKREGQGYTEIESTPVGGAREFVYAKEFARITFSPDNPFNNATDPSSSTDVVGEKIWILYRQ
jgi:hypothetical protein